MCSQNSGHTILITNQFYSDRMNCYWFNYWWNKRSMVLFIDIDLCLLVSYSIVLFIWFRKKHHNLYSSHPLSVFTVAVHRLRDFTRWKLIYLTTMKLFENELVIILSKLIWFNLSYGRNIILRTRIFIMLLMKYMKCMKMHSSVRETDWLSLNNVHV